MSTLEYKINSCADKVCSLTKYAIFLFQSRGASLGMHHSGKKITAGHRPKTDPKAGMAVHLLNSPDIKPTRAK